MSRALAKRHNFTNYERLEGAVTLGSDAQAQLPGVPVPT